MFLSDGTKQPAGDRGPGHLRPEFALGKGTSQALPTGREIRAVSTGAPALATIACPAKAATSMRAPNGSIWSSARRRARRSQNEAKRPENVCGYQTIALAKYPRFFASRRGPAHPIGGDPSPERQCGIIIPRSSTQDVSNP